jgi:hypothetical protein
MSINKTYQKVKSALFSKLSWFNNVTQVTKGEVFELYGAEKHIPKDVFMMDAADIVKTIAVSTRVVKYLTKVYESALESIPVEWYQKEQSEDKILVALRKQIVTVKRDITKQQDGYESAQAVMDMAKTTKSIANNKKFMNMQKAIIKNYELAKESLEGLVKQLAESGASNTEEKILSPNGVIMATLKYISLKEGVETSTEIINHAKNAKNWKDAIGECFKRWTVEHPEQAYEKGLSLKGVDFTVEQLVSKVEACKINS